jgi:hypothetical protein
VSTPARPVAAGDDPTRPVAPGDAAARRPAALTPLEIASGLVLEDGRPRGRLAGPAGAGPRAALEAAVLPALLRPPCLLSFSGGRDSSAVLALATAVARREGLSPPIPATNRFAHAVAAAESEWQERVVAHLGLRDWVRLDLTDELDVVGPVAEAALRRHGLLWPSNAHFHVPVFEAATGGSVLTGIGGDEALSPSHARLRAVAARRARPRPRDLLRAGFAAAPRAVRRRVIERGLCDHGQWLRPEAERAVRRALAAERAGEPVRWRAWYDWLVGARYLDVGLASLEALAADEAVEVRHPFCDRGFLAALAALPPARRFTTRTEAMDALVGDVLPPGLRARTTKACFDEAFWTDRARAAAAAWDGAGVDPELVDRDRLRAEWASPSPDPRSFTLLQRVLLTPP